MSDEERANIVAREVSPHWQGAMWIESQRSPAMVDAPTPDDLAKLLSYCCDKRALDHRRTESGARRKNHRRTIYNSDVVDHATRSKVADPERQVEIQEQREFVLERAKAFSPVVRECVILTLGGMNQYEIAAKTGGSRSNVSRSLTIAKKALKAMVG